MPTGTGESKSPLGQHNMPTLVTQGFQKNPPMGEGAGMHDQGISTKTIGTVVIILALTDIERISRAVPLCKILRIN
ncbi:MAG: hypothetical protein D6676_00585 [Cyanobacteria bacterium J003]|nr:MAG: hypothetical protein D6676_00585 [Cyanobacteria bacterium J003]